MENSKPIHPVSYQGGISGFYACRAASFPWYFAFDSFGRSFLRLLHQVKFEKDVNI
ncbi:hypothetical protein M752DRAFT_279220 [Aspergillus phoenicis ATCC 13157]|nr:hypothetical protein M752DRAFT_279220 [Aspergillus phoenicis ATCC 13157]